MKGVRPWLLVGCMAAFMILGAIAPAAGLLSAAIYLASACLAYCVATFLCAAISLEYLPKLNMRIAWVALAGTALLSLFRYPFQLSPQLFDLGPHAKLIAYLLITFAWLSLLAGLCAMCGALFQVGLGFELKRSDIAGMAAIFICLSTILLFKRSLSDSQSPLHLFFYIQIASHVLLAATAAVAIVLHRLAMEMGGGKLAWAIRFIIFHVILRAAIALVPIVSDSLWPSFDTGPLVHWCMFAPPWIFAIAAANRLQIVPVTLHEVREIACSFSAQQRVS